MHDIKRSQTDCKSELHSRCNVLLLKGETEKSRTHKYLVQANSLHSAAKQKEKELAEIRKELELKLSRLKDKIPFVY